MNRAAEIYHIVLLLFIINTSLYLAELISEFEH